MAIWLWISQSQSETLQVAIWRQLQLVVRGTTYLRCGTVVNQGTYAVPALTMPQSHDADAVADDGAAPPAPMTMTSCPGSFGN
ncbi:GM14800 [Drosophila sechellia]|uniref:GD13971 n=2 Tax=melanogaster subgroup TaxID=32351 RepID=B4QJT8_DROSI|nr:GM14800 [Drosophila sechellia]EDX09479.1 GD13971 [Drosophila simulans]